MLYFSSGNWPFQLAGQATLLPGKSVSLYQTGQPDQQYLLTYHLENDNSNVLGFGVNNQGWGYDYNQIKTLTINPVENSCAIKPENGDTKRCWVIKNN